MNKTIGRVVVVGLALSYALAALLYGFATGFVIVFMSVMALIGVFVFGAIASLFVLYLMYLFTDNDAEDFDRYMDRL